MDINNAENENYLFQEDNKLPVLREEDDHELHLKQHNILRKSDWYREVLCGGDEPSTLAKEFDKHCEAHKSRLIKESEEKANETPV